jgi:hypothetical protein
MNKFSSGPNAAVWRACQDAASRHYGAIVGSGKLGLNGSGKKFYEF